MSERVARGKFEGVDLDQLSRIFELLRTQLPRVLAANRHFEERTGLHNEAGTNNLVDALSHLGTLVKHADELDSEGQAEQVAHLEDHLRRSMMEAFEQLVKLYLGRAAELWDLHTREVRPLILSGTLRGAAPLEQLEALRVEVRDLLDKGRETKRAPNWEAWEEGTDYFVQACDKVDLLHRLLEEGLASAERHRAVQRQQKRLRFEFAAAATSGILGVLLGVLLGRVV